MNKLYGRIEAVTPPVVFGLLKRSFIYHYLKKYFNQKVSIKPSPHNVRDGILNDRKLFFNGNIDWQKDMLTGTYDDFIFDYLKKLDLKGKTILDIGAHIGYSTLCFAELVGENGHVLTFEPSPYNITYIEKHLELNPNLNKRIQLFKVAVSDNDGTDDFVFSNKVEEGMSSGSFIESADPIWEKEIFENKTGFKRMSVKTVKLDSLREIQNPYIIKIDVEGAESLVLKGAIELIRKYSPVILLEIHSIQNMYLVMKFLTENKYKTELMKKEPDGRCFLSAIRPI